MNKAVKGVILFSTFYLLIYVLSTHLPISLAVPLALFSLSPLVVIHLVYTVLKKGIPSNLSFDEAFYEDHPYRRVQGPESQQNDWPKA